MVTGTDKNQLHGNYGIRDQKMAIKWYYLIHHIIFFNIWPKIIVNKRVKNNIEAFFGDPDRVYNILS